MLLSCLSVFDHFLGLAFKGLSSVITNELLLTPSVFNGNNKYSKRSLLYSPKAWALAVVDFMLNDPSIYNPSSEITVLKAI